MKAGGARVDVKRWTLYWHLLALPDIGGGGRCYLVVMEKNIKLDRNKKISMILEAL